MCICVCATCVFVDHVVAGKWREIGEDCGTSFLVSHTSPPVDSFSELSLFQADIDLCSTNSTQGVTDDMFTVSELSLVISIIRSLLHILVTL